MNKRFFIIFAFIIIGIFIYNFFISKQTQPSSTPSTGQTTATAPRSIVFEKITPFPLDPTPISFFPAFSTQPVFPSSLHQYSTDSFNFSERAAEIARSFSFSNNPTTLESSPAVLRWNNEAIYLLFMEATGLLEYTTLVEPSSSSFIAKTEAENLLKQFISEKKLLPENFSFSIVSSFPINVTETVLQRASSPSVANAILLQGILQFKDLPFIDSSYPIPPVQAIINSSGIQKLTLILPPSLSVSTEEVSLNSSSVIENLQKNKGKVVLVFSEKSIQETETNIPISSVSVNTISAGYVWDKKGKIVEPAFIASGQERRGGTYLYYILPNTL